MLDQTRTEPEPPHRPDIVDSAAKLVQQTLGAFTKALNTGGGGNFGSRDPLGMSSAMLELAARLVAEPERLVQAQASLWWDYHRLSQRTFWRLCGLESEPVIEPTSGDRRFKDAAWDENALFDTIKQFYLLSAHHVLEALAGVDGLDEKTHQRLTFYAQQIVDALAPNNFALSNPTVLRSTLESGGQNLVQGLRNLLNDVANSDGHLNVSTVDHDAFEVGVNLANTPGKVIFQNELMQLIQYSPATERVARRPLLIVPPWMNKYYIMDLSPKNSMIKWLVEQGHTVFMVSWVNPDAELAHKRLDDYMLEGPLAALDAIEQATGEREVNAVGYCLGGILLASTMAYMSAKGDDRIKCASYLTTMVDFADAGDVTVFIDDEQLEQLEKQINEKGFLDGNIVGLTFRALRANDLVWSFFVNNYLLGKDPLAFDLLYWNADATNMPAATHTFIMRHMYLRNRLREPGEISLDGVPIDVTRVKTPAYILSAREDHIAPWKTTYETTQLFSGPVKFVLGASGHIAGVINPPVKEKYGYWTNNKTPADSEAWLDGAKQHVGSWWPDWSRWLKRYAGGAVAPRNPGAGKLKAIEDAPGSFVQMRL